MTGYHERKRRAKNFVAVTETSDGAHFCEGIYDSAAEAYGNVMLNIWDFADSYTDEGDVFDIGKPYVMDCDGGCCIEVKYRKKDWTHEAETQRYYVLFDGEVEIDEKT